MPKKPVKRKSFSRQKAGGQKKHTRRTDITVGLDKNTVRATFHKPKKVSDQRRRTVKPGKLIETNDPSWIERKDTGRMRTVVPRNHVMQGDRILASGFYKRGEKTFTRNTRGISVSRNKKTKKGRKGNRKQSSGRASVSSIMKMVSKKGKK